MLKEAKRLYDMGFAVHFIKPNSKAPVKSGWSGPIRDDWETVQRDYVLHYGLGVRLGESSKILSVTGEASYLANIDIDIKSSNPVHAEEARAFVEDLFPGLLQTAPVVQTGYGKRIFVRTTSPLPSRKLGAAADECKVFMPSAERNRRQELAVGEGKITAKELGAGYRMRPAWEVEFMSAGKQVVLPPSIHPDTGKPYVWVRGIDQVRNIPVIDDTIMRGGGRGQCAGAKTRKAAMSPVDFKPVKVRLKGRLSDEYIQMLDEDGPDDSATVFTICLAMVKQGFEDLEIMTVLTDERYLMSRAAIKRRGLDRSSQAAWIFQHNVVKARETLWTGRPFEVPIGDVVRIEGGAEGVAAQKIELCGESGWQDRIKRTGKDGMGPPKPIMNNIIEILNGEFSSKLFREDLFANRTIYGCDTPWGGKTDNEFSDKDRVLLAEWLSKRWHFEPRKDLIYDSAVAIAAHNAFHPIKDYLESLEWDGEPRTHSWLAKYMHAHDVRQRYLADVSHKVLCAMIARVYKPGCKFDYMLILRGDQGIRKSSALSILAGEKYFSSTTLHVGDKDSILKMQGKWIIEFGELSTLKADVRALKNFITTQADRERLPYGRLAHDFLRASILTGSTNQDDFLCDDTGDRRFWPVSVSDVDLEGLAQARDQLLAEAKYYFDLDEPLYLTRDIEQEAKGEQARWRPLQDVMIEKVGIALEINRKRDEKEAGRFPDNGFSLAEVMSKLDCRDDLQTQRRVGAALKANGFTKSFSRARGVPRNLWFKTDTISDLV